MGQSLRCCSLNGHCHGLSFWLDTRSKQIVLKKIFFFFPFLICFCFNIYNYILLKKRKTKMLCFEFLSYLCRFHGRSFGGSKNSLKHMLIEFFFFFRCTWSLIDCGTNLAMRFYLFLFGHPRTNLFCWHNIFETSIEIRVFRSTSAIRHADQLRLKLSNRCQTQPNKWCDPIPGNLN